MRVHLDLTAAKRALVVIHSAISPHLFPKPRLSTYAGVLKERTTALLSGLISTNDLILFASFPCLPFYSLLSANANADSLLMLAPPAPRACDNNQAWDLEFMVMDGGYLFSFSIFLPISHDLGMKLVVYRGWKLEVHSYFSRKIYGFTESVPSDLSFFPFPWRLSFSTSGVLGSYGLGIME